MNDCAGYVRRALVMVCVVGLGWAVSPLLHAHNELQMTASKTSLVADGLDTATLQLRAFNEVLVGSTPVHEVAANVTVTLAAYGPGTISGPNPVTTDASGNAESAVRSTTEAGTIFVVATAVGYSSATLTLTSTAPPPPPDTTPPSIAITSPADGATVSGAIMVSVSASDNVGVSRVEFRVDGALAAISTVPPHGFLWNTTTLPNGLHSLEARAFDGAGNNSAHTISVTVFNGPPPDTTPPSIAITSPANGATVSGTVTMSGTASDNVALARIEVQIDAGPFNLASGLENWSYSFDASGLSSGMHVLSARATDTSNNVQITSITVNVPAPPPPPDTTPPSIAITSPANGATVSGTVTMSGTASDNVALARIEVQIDAGPFNLASGLENWSYSFDASGLSPGYHTIMARATDTNANTGGSSVTVRVADIVAITDAECHTESRILEVEATSSVPFSILTVVGFGIMQEKNAGEYKFHAKVASCPASVTVQSSNGGSASQFVRVK